MESYPVELWRDDESGRLVIRARNEGGHSATFVDLADLVKWLKDQPHTEQFNEEVHGRG